MNAFGSISYFKKKPVIRLVLEAITYNHAANLKDEKLSLFEMMVVALASKKGFAVEENLIVSTTFLGMVDLRKEFSNVYIKDEESLFINAMFVGEELTYNQVKQLRKYVNDSQTSICLAIVDLLESCEQDQEDIDTVLHYYVHILPTIITYDEETEASKKLAAAGCSVEPTRVWPYYF